MQVVGNIQFIKGSKEEALPEMPFGFPHLASYVEFNKETRSQIPWHWHKEMELFYIEQGNLEYHTPGGRTFFPPGSAGLINSNILHMTKQPKGEEKTIQKVHIFDVSLIGGRPGSLMEQKYIRPLITSPSIEVLGFYPQKEEHKEILEKVRKSFEIGIEEFAYEIKLNELLSGIWYRLLETLEETWQEKQGKSPRHEKANEKLKMMLSFIHEHYDEKISVKEIADAAFISERECFRSFKENMRMTPIEYLNDYRFQLACNLLITTREPITSIGNACGLGSSSYFGRVFRENKGCTPMEYRKKWQDSEKDWH